MYVCICNAIRECELRQAARASSGDAEALYIQIGRPPQCGQCIDEAEEIIAEERVSDRLPVPRPSKDSYRPLHT
ncbi:(2Fe-2S)-binding protein [Novosphingobium sp. M1R2S20]|uniref:Bacterioferritin-associated ferredoxin n=1 Tax=Novosphingobium rhizovicinum TaxID=3228928 RepID=A0ABV3R8Q2_9SPHN